MVLDRTFLVADRTAASNAWFAEWRNEIEDNFQTLRYLTMQKHAMSVNYYSALMRGSAL
jgi:hypothetical protein